MSHVRECFKDTHRHAVGVLECHADIYGLQQVIENLVVICDCSNVRRRDMSFASKDLDRAHDTDVAVLPVSESSALRSRLSHQRSDTVHPTAHAEKQGGGPLDILDSVHFFSLIVC